ncbi:MAG: GNAT family N-acetyltransferase [Alphaproteobacteria bacterium]|nr:GNAT family N-acetyltransferase [Alphaproteobacteria bacterium]
MYRPFEDRDQEALARAQALSFGFPAAEAPRWWKVGGHENLRVWDEGGTVRAGLFDIPMGMFVGGSSIPLHGVAGVFVVPEARGRGLGRRLMEAYVGELAERGIALSALYASTRALYRSVGYGIAGNRYLAELPTELFRAVGDRSGDWRPLEESDWTAIQAGYRSEAARHTGWLDRGPYIWARLREHRGEPNVGWVLEGDGLEAWLVVRQTRDGEWLKLSVIDAWAQDAKALRRIAGLLATFASMARTVTIPCGPSAPLIDLLPEHRVDVKLHEPWLLRVVDVKRALEARGWPPGFAATLDLDVRDPLVRANERRLRVGIADGRATVEEGGTGALRVGVRGLAGLFTGYATPHDLALRGELAGTDDAMRTATAAFAGPAPSLVDFF